MEDAQGSRIILSWQTDLEPSEIVTDSTSVWAALGTEKIRNRDLGFTSSSSFFLLAGGHAWICQSPEKGQRCREEQGNSSPSECK